LGNGKSATRGLGAAASGVCGEVHNAKPFAIGAIEIEMRVILVIGGVLWAVTAIAPTHATVTIQEKFYFSRTCPGEGNHWFVEKYDNDGLTVECDYEEDAQ